MMHSVAFMSDDESVRPADIVFLNDLHAPSCGDFTASASALLERVESVLAEHGMTKHHIVDVKTVLRQINPDLKIFNEMYNTWMKGVDIVPAQTACQLYDFDESRPAVSLSLTCTRQPKRVVQGQTQHGPLQKLGASEAVQTPMGPMYLPFSAVVPVGNMVWLSGQLDVSSGDNVEQQIAATTRKIESLLSSCGLSKEHIRHSEILFPKRLTDEQIENLRLFYESFMAGSSAPLKFVKAAATCANCNVEICVMASATTSLVKFE
jgi:enamine deaminase RidA (YjgF/YER057c/UK114 family)